MKVGIYARFSSELQDVRSIDDQAALCRDYATRQNWNVVDLYADRAISGASVHGRFAFERMIADARAGRIEAILAEDLDRLSRNQADIASLFERMTFAGIELWTVADGRVSEMHVGLKGTMSALFLRNLALKTHRGLQGRVREGKSAGGRCYGYRVSAVGEREVEEAEAAIVRRIFAETIDGATPREIVARLNAEGVPAPRGGAWNASTLNGSRARANGILRNELYVGRMVWNRQRFVKDPDTGRRVSRANAATARQTADVPHLRVVEQLAWDQVQAILKDKGHANSAHARRPKHLLSGLCRCGHCGGSFVVTGTNQLGCSTRREKATCDNDRRIAVSLVEKRILSALEEHLLHPDVVAAAVKEYAAERRRVEAGARADALRRERRLGEIKREANRILDVVVISGATEEMVERLKALEGERASLAESAVAAPPTIAIHPAVAERYRAIVKDLRAQLAAAKESERRDVLETVRSLIEKVVIYPRNAERDLELYGTLAALLGGSEQGRKDYVGLVVAGTGFEPVTFRL